MSRELILSEVSMKMIINEMKVRLVARGESEAVSRAIIAAFVSSLNPTVEELLDLRCAVSEAVTNCVVHAYVDREPYERCYIYISVRLYSNNEVSVEIRDTGVGIADVEEAMRPQFTTGGDERSGMGFLVMESFCDTVRVKSRLGRGTSVLLRKKFGA